ncbi:AGAP010452-PA [Anopheles gambiae str. PEST]|uniref:AGAP010452-PA n=1 Tax=Anopheles gambiae TaxID=7165 RepID=Q5TUD1_ANOGA|nr:AGAP010452-PA [Anopheles gambiae str. PEST]
MISRWIILHSLKSLLEEHQTKKQSGVPNLTVMCPNDQCPGQHILWHWILRQIWANVSRNLKCRKERVLLHHHPTPRLTRLV